MPVISPHAYREWILLYGPFCSGKTHAYLSLAQFYAQTQTPGVFHIIDTDYAVRVQMEKFPEIHEVKDGGNLSIYECYDFADMQTAAKSISDTARPSDWVVLDKETTAWKGAPDYYCRSRFDKSADQIEMEYKQLMERLGKPAVDSGLLRYYGNGINPMYEHEFRDLLLYKSRANVIICADSKEVNSSDPKSRGPRDSRDVAQQFEQVGFKPAGQKDTPGKMHTIILLDQRYRGRWFATTVRERGDRQSWSNQELVSFPHQYLLGPAEWKVQ